MVEIHGVKREEGLLVRLTVVQIYLAVYSMCQALNDLVIEIFNKTRNDNRIKCHIQAQYSTTYMYMFVTVASRNQALGQRCSRRHRYTSYFLEIMRSKKSTRNFLKELPKILLSTYRLDVTVSLRLGYGSTLVCKGQLPPYLLIYINDTETKDSVVYKLAYLSCSSINLLVYKTLIQLCTRIFIWFIGFFMIYKVINTCISQVNRF